MRAHPRHAHAPEPRPIFVRPEQVQAMFGISYEVAEAALGHAVGGKVERTYARSDLLDRRRPVMDAWAAHVTGREAADVVAIRG